MSYGVMQCHMSSYDLVRDRAGVPRAARARPGALARDPTQRDAPTACLALSRPLDRATGAPRAARARPQAPRARAGRPGGSGGRLVSSPTSWGTQVVGVVVASSLVGVGRPSVGGRLSPVRTRHDRASLSHPPLLHRERVAARSLHSPLHHSERHSRSSSSSRRVVVVVTAHPPAARRAGRGRGADGARPLAARRCDPHAAPVHRARCVRRMTPYDTV